MSSKTSSPTAHLLRSSRVFSMPRPLPLPQNDLQGHVQSNRNSPTATQPYPIQQAVATTPSALYRGDWGLKRSLPLRSTTKSSTPTFRINAIDTREHITDFESAADLTLNQKKIQELNLSVTTAPQRVKKSVRNQRRNVFEPDLDNTARDIPEGHVRWKFKGPWVAGMTQGDFEDYLNRELKNRKSEFNIFLREHARSAIETQKRAETRHEGYASQLSSDPQQQQQTDPQDDTSPNPEDHPLPPISVTPQEIDTYIQHLRHTFTLSSELATLLQNHLDLPATAGPSLENYQKAFYENGPPKTHPSAGLSYLRSDAHLENHPLFGPQKSHAPVEARLLHARTRNVTVGVAGVVGREPSGMGGKVRSSPNRVDDEDPLEVQDRKLGTIGLATKGGNRIWVHPTSLGLNSRGRVELATSNADGTAVGVHTGVLAGPGYAEGAKRPVVRGLDEGDPTTGQSGMAGLVPPRRNGLGGAGRAQGQDTAQLMGFLQEDAGRRSRAGDGGASR